LPFPLFPLPPGDLPLPMGDFDLDDDVEDVCFSARIERNDEV
jgi:hypothetical protein